MIELEKVVDPTGVPFKMLRAAPKLVPAASGQSVVMSGRASPGGFPLRVDQFSLLEVAQQAVDDTRVALGAPKPELGKSAADLIAVGATLLKDEQDERLGVAAETCCIAIEGLAGSSRRTVEKTSILGLYLSDPTRRKLWLVGAGLLHRYTLRMQ